MCKLRFNFVFCLIGSLLCIPACTPARSADVPKSKIYAESKPSAVVRILNLNAMSITTQLESPLSIQTTDQNNLLPLSEPTPTRANYLQTKVPHSNKACINRATFIRHLTIADKSSLEAGQSFAKIWRLRNDGTCTWNPSYSLIFLNGEKMGGPDEVKLSKNVHPGEEIDLRIDLVAPQVTALYTSTWKLRDDEGDVFGFGASGNESLPVVITIKPRPRPTSS